MANYRCQLLFTLVTDSSEYESSEDDDDEDLINKKSIDHEDRIQGNEEQIVDGTIDLAVEESNQITTNEQILLEHNILIFDDCRESQSSDDEDGSLLLLKHTWSIFQ